MWNGLGNKPSLFPTVDLFDAACKHESFSIINRIFLYFKLFFQCILAFLPSMEKSLIFCLCLYSLCRSGNNHFDVHFRLIGRVLFRRKMEKTRSVKEEMDGSVFISRQGRHLSSDKYYDSSTFPYLYLDLACKQLCFPPRKGINRRNKSTVVII